MIQWNICDSVDLIVHLVERQSPCYELYEPIENKEVSQVTDMAAPSFGRRLVQ